MKDVRMGPKENVNPSCAQLETPKTAARESWKDGAEVGPAWRRRGTALRAREGGGKGSRQPTSRSHQEGTVVVNLMSNDITGNCREQNK